MNIRSVQYCFYFILILLFPFHGFSQDFVSETSDEIVISLDKLDLPLDKNNRDITIISSEQIANMPVRSVNDILAYIAGIDVRQRGVNGAQADISIEGGTFDQLIVLINGHKMSDPQTGHNMMNIPVSIDAIERIEVLKGPAASRYGVNGLTGVINIVTKRSSGKELIISANAGSNYQNDTSTSRMYNNYGIQITESRKLENWNHLISLSYDQSNGYRHNSAYRNVKALFTGHQNIKDNIHLKMILGYVNNDFDAKDFYAYPRDAQSGETVETFISGLRVPVYFSNGSVITPYVTYRHTYDDYIFVKSDPGIFRNQHYSNVVDAGADYVFHNAIGMNVVGFNTRYESINSTNLGERERTNWGIFYENYNRFANVFDMRIGGFVNYNSVFGLKVYPQLELGYAPQEHLRVYGNAGIGQRLPTFTDLYYTSPNNVGNDTLTPEHAMNVEMGMKFSNDNFDMGLAVFHRWGYDMIDWIRKDTTEAWRVYNFSQINIAGLKMNARYRLDFNEKGHMILQGSYTYLYPEIKNSNDPDKAVYMSQYTINALKHHWVGSATYSIARYSFSLSHRYLNRYVSDGNIHPDFRKDYHILDFKTGVQLNNLNLNISLQNLSNTTYIEAGMVTMPQFWMSVSAQYKFY